MKHIQENRTINAEKVIEIQAPNEIWKVAYKYEAFDRFMA